jgi:DNA-binding winged helix-turn-helix (wHTH) protein
MANGMMGDRPSAAPRPNAERGRRRWRFAASILDERTLELLVNGLDAELERKPLEVLIYLLEHAGEVCTKDEILTGVWPGRILSETVLTKCIGRLREVLGDRDQHIIKTAYGFGYRFIASVQVELAPTPGPRAWISSRVIDRQAARSGAWSSGSVSVGTARLGAHAMKRPMNSACSSSLSMRPRSGC